MGGIFRGRNQTPQAGRTWSNCCEMACAGHSGFWKNKESRLTFPEINNTLEEAIKSRELTQFWSPPWRHHCGMRPWDLCSCTSAFSPWPLSLRRSFPFRPPRTRKLLQKRPRRPSSYPRIPPCFQGRKPKIWLQYNSFFNINFLTSAIRGKTAVYGGTY